MSDPVGCSPADDCVFCQYENTIHIYVFPSGDHRGHPAADVILQVYRCTGERLHL